MGVCDIELEALLPQLSAVRVEGLQVGAGLVRVTARTRGGGNCRTVWMM